MGRSIPNGLGVLSNLCKPHRRHGGGLYSQEEDMTNVVLNGRDITNDLAKLIIQTGTKNSDVVILKLRYFDGRVDTKILVEQCLQDNHKIIRKES